MDEKIVIKNSFDNIKASDARKKQIYRNVKTSFDDSGKLSKKKFVFFKRVFDRYVPAMAACAVCFALFALYSVSAGLFGTPYISSKDIEEMYHGNDEVGEIAGAEKSSVWTDFFDPTTTGGYDVFTLENGEPTLYKFVSDASDVFVFWNEIQSNKLVPENIALNDAVLEGSTMLLHFSYEIKDVDQLTLCGILKSIQGYYNYSYSVNIMAGDKEVELDSSYLLEYDYLEAIDFEG